MDNMAIDISNLDYRVGKRYLLHNINWQVQAGDSWVVFGMNGSGKTTLLSIIAGFNRYSQGNIRIFGQAYSEATTQQIRKDVGLVSASFFDRIYTRERVLDIVLSGLSGTIGVRGTIQNSDLIKSRELLAQLGVVDKIRQPFSELSKGERQKVLLARAFISDPRLLILDEPATGLDVMAREQLLALIQELNKEKITLIYVTHYPEEILDIFDHALLLQDGRIYKVGPTAELFTEQTMGAFLGRRVNIQLNKGRYTITSIEGDGHAGK